MSKASKIVGKGKKGEGRQMMGGGCWEGNKITVSYPAGAANVLTQRHTLVPSSLLRPLTSRNS